MRWEDRRLKRDSGEGFGGRRVVGWGIEGLHAGGMDVLTGVVLCGLRF